jgi:hypothetical protein
MVRSALLALLLFVALPGPPAAASVPAPWLSRQPADITAQLAARHVPAADGALGRNKAGYFHARFQLGVHLLATQAVLARDPDAAARSLQAIAYALARQQDDGRFALVVPAKLAAGKPANAADLASGSAFFLASAGTAVVLLGEGEAAPDPAWLTPALRAQRDALRPGLRRALAALVEDSERLAHADARAPNRLLFDALAFRSLGLALDDPAALARADDFVRAALALQHRDGYFIEGGGFDSSYNGVACAIGYRLLGLDPGHRELAQALGRAMAWQRTRIADDGTVRTDGNTRVKPGGESFLGQAKQVDVPHTVESLSLAAAHTGDPAWADLARRVVARYRDRR